MLQLERTAGSRLIVNFLRAELLVQIILSRKLRRHVAHLNPQAGHLFLLLADILRRRHFRHTGRGRRSCRRRTRHGRWHNLTILAPDPGRTLAPKVPIILDQRSTFAPILARVRVLLAIGQLLIAQHSSPARLAVAFPRTPTISVDATRIRVTLGALLSHPSHSATALSRPTTITVLAVAVGRANR